MNFLRNFSIRNKLTAILFFLSFISLVLGFTFVIIHDISTFKRDMMESTVTVARVIGDYSVVDLAFLDARASEETLSKLSAIPDIQCAALYDAAGKLFSTYRKAGCNFTSVVPASVEFREGYLQVFEAVRTEEQFYGTLYLQISTKRLNEKIESYLISMLTLTAILLVIAFVLALRFQLFISSPLVELAEATRKISEEPDYTLRINYNSEDELGVLVRGFNEMLSQIQRRIEERDMAEIALRESEDRYRILVESSPEAILLEKDGRIVYCNRAGLRMLQYDSIEQFRDVPLQSLFVYSSKVEAAAGQPREAYFVRRDGRRIELEVTFVDTLYQGGPALQCVVRDITESKNLRQAALRMERLAALGEFSAMLAHEIRNSLGTISLNVRMLLERLEAPPTQRKALENTELAVQRMQSIIKAILDFATPAPPKLQMVSIAKLLDSSLHIVEHDLQESGIVVQKQYDPADPSVLIDPNQVTQVFVNLLLNARQAIDGPGGTITIRTMKYESGVELKITDTGRGIPPENIDRIFDPFFTTTPLGSGLGLAFVSRILEQHDAEIFVESTPGSGTTFTIRFEKALERAE